MASSPVYAPVLLGLGATELSMNVNSIPRIRKIVSEIALEEAQEIVGKLDECRTASEVEQMVSEFYQNKWAHLFSNGVFPLNTNEKNKIY